MTQSTLSVTEEESRGHTAAQSRVLQAPLPRLLLPPPPPEQPGTSLLRAPQVIRFSIVSFLIPIFRPVFFVL